MNSTLCINNYATCKGPITAKQLCRSCYKREYRAANLDRVKTREKALRLKFPDRNRKQCDKFKASAKGIFSALRNEAKRRNLPVGLPFKEFEELWNAPCTYCDNPEIDSKGGYRLDRIENSLGYYEWNVVPSCGDCNKIRGDRLSHIEMIFAMRAVISLRSSAYKICVLGDALTTGTD